MPRTKTIDNLKVTLVTSSTVQSSVLIEAMMRPLMSQSSVRILRLCAVRK